MNTKTKLSSLLIGTYVAIMATVVLTYSPNQTPDTKPQSVLSHTNTPTWIELEPLEVRAPNPMPLRKPTVATDTANTANTANRGRCNGEDCSAPRPGEEAAGKAPCRRGNVWMMCPIESRTVTELAQGGRPGATTVVRLEY